jgi:hypothetical protein
MVLMSATSKRMVSAKHVEDLFDGTMAKRVRAVESIIGIGTCYRHGAEFVAYQMYGNSQYCKQPLHHVVESLCAKSERWLWYGILEMRRQEEHSPRLPSNATPPCWLVDKHLHISLN